MVACNLTSCLQCRLSEAKLHCGLCRRKQSTVLALNSCNTVELSLKTGDQNQCGRFRDFVIFIPAFHQVTTLPTMQFSHQVTSLEAIYHITSTFGWRLCIFFFFFFFFFTYAAVLPKICTNAYCVKLVATPFNDHIFLSYVFMQLKPVFSLKKRGQ